MTSDIAELIFAFPLALACAAAEVSVAHARKP
jgi:hypothetical protein